MYIGNHRFFSVSSNPRGSTFLGNKIKFMSENDLYELGKDDAPNWPLPPKAFQKGIVADRNPYRIFGLAEFD